MDTWMLWTVAALYGYASLKAFFFGSIPHGLIFGGYAIAGVAIIYTLPRA